LPVADPNQKSPGEVPRATAAPQLVAKSLEGQAAIGPLRLIAKQKFSPTKEYGQPDQAFNEEKHKPGQAQPFYIFLYFFRIHQHKINHFPGFTQTPVWLLALKRAFICNARRRLFQSWQPAVRKSALRIQSGLKIIFPSGLCLFGLAIKSKNPKSTQIRGLPGYLGKIK
jgi:hypothetical protein